MEKIDFVLVGAEGVVESGGIINKVCGICSFRSLPELEHIALKPFFEVRVTFVFSVPFVYSSFSSV